MRTLLWAILLARRIARTEASLARDSPRRAVALWDVVCTLDRCAVRIRSLQDNTQ